MYNKVMIVKIDADSFGEDCQPHISEEDLPCMILIDDEDQYRLDAAQANGLLTHSPYCLHCM